MTTPEIVLEYHAPDAVVLDENVRRTSKAPAWLVESVRAQGVLAPVIAHRDMLGNIVVTDGQLRVLAAREAICETIPVLVGPAPGSAEARVIEQLTLNEAREKMSTADVAEAVKQLSLFGMEASSIARKIGRSTADVDTLQRIAKSEAASRAAASTPQVSMVDLATLAEISQRPGCTPEMLKEAEATIAEKPENAFFTLRRLQDSVDEEELLMPLLADLSSVEVIRSTDNSKDCALKNLVDGDGQPLDEVEHESCPGHAVLAHIGYEYIEHKPHKKAMALLVCREYAAHGHKTSWQYTQDVRQREIAEKKAEREAAMQEAMRREVEWATAHEARVEFAKELLLKGAVGSFEWAVSSLFGAMENLGEWGLLDPTDLLEGVGVIPTRVTLAGLARSHAKNARLVVFAAALEYQLNMASVPPLGDETDSEIVAFIDQLIEWGYKPLPVEQEELDAAAEAESGDDE